MCALQDVLEGGRKVEVLVDGEGHSEVDVVDEFVLAAAHHSHRIIHGDFMEVMAGKDCSTTFGDRGDLAVQHRQQ